jgi:hypothetical protein
MNKKSQNARCAAAALVAAGFWVAGCSVEERAFTTSSTSTGTGGGSAACNADLICDDFEALEPQSTPGGALSAAFEMGTVVVDAERAKSGGQSIKLTTNAADGFKAALLRYSDGSKLPTSGNVIFGRMMFFLESVPAQELHWSFIIGKGVVPGADYQAVYRYGGQHPVVDGGGKFIGSQLMANYETPNSYDNPPIGPATDCWQHADQKIVPVGQWSCVEFRLDGSTNEMQLWLDGVEIPDLHMKGTGQGCYSQPADYTWMAPSFTEIYLGWESYALDEARTIWIDDVALGTAPVGCP